MKKPAKKPVKPKTVKTHSASGSGTLHAGGMRRTQRKASASAGLHRVSHRASASAPLTGAKKAAKKPVTAKKRQWSPGCDVACCSAQALGTLLGWGHEDVLALYWRMASDPDAGASIQATLEAARALFPGLPYHQANQADDDGQQHAYQVAESPERVGFSHAAILGVTLPEPHAVAVTPDGRWWSWGEPFSPGDWPELAVEEAWAVLL